MTIKWKEYRDKILSMIDNEAFYTDEFKRLNLAYSRNGYEIKACCPFGHLHPAGRDTSPSFTVNIEKGVYFCNACGSKGNIHTFYSLVYEKPAQDTWFVLGDALGLPRPEDTMTRPMIDPGLPAKYHRALMDNTGTIRDILRDRRGLTDATLARFLIGWDGQRITIPIYNEFNELVNIRRYMWNSQDDNLKMINYVDDLQNSYGEDRIFGIEHLYDESVDKIIWCEGEWDRILAEQNGNKACTSTCGANNFKYEWFRLLKRKKEVWVCYDNDDAGRQATTAMLEGLHKDVKLSVVDWPTNFDEKGDVTDIFVKFGFTNEKFLALFKAVDYGNDIPLVSLATSSNAKYAGKRIRVPVLVAGKENSPFIYPKRICITCDGGEERKSCAGCSLSVKKKIDRAFLSNEALMLKLIDCPDERQRGLLKAVCGVDPKCFNCHLDVKEYGNLEIIHMIPKADANFGFAQKQSYVARSGYIQGDNLPTNKRYTLLGYMHADPTTQRATYIFDEAVPEKDLLDDLEITTEVNDKLKIFQRAPGQSVLDKFNEIHADLERNVTYIWDRRKVGIATDLVYHTVLNFYFQEQMVKRGWAECLIIGDSGQAKTTIVERLMNHYGCGELLSGESSRRTGLVYSLQQSGSQGHWSLMWGAMPLNDGGLLTIDELSGMAEDDLAKMSDVRSSGIAKTTGVITAETTARTRIIFISNPRNGRQLKSENYGMSAILKLFGKAEDVRRLDFAIAVASGEVDANIVNRSISEMPAVEHRYTNNLCKMRVLWAWSRRPDQIQFTDEAITTILQHASSMGKKYSSRIPLVEPADQRIKLARLSIATAACMYSTDDGTNIIVEKDHVEFVVNYLEELYDSKALGYDRMSADDFENSDTTDGAILRLRNEFISIPFATREISDIVKALYQLPYFNRNTLEDATGLDRDELKNLLQFLISHSVVEKAGQDYKRTAMGLAFIEQLLLSPPTMIEVRRLREERIKNSQSQV